MISNYDYLERIRQGKPLVHHITNWVTISDCANVTRACGALPVMAHAEEEVEEMSALASALVLNIGTLTPPLISAMLRAAQAANRKGIPVVLDAVGAGATALRTSSAKRLVREARISIIKGNAGEIATLCGAAADVRGVESMGFQGNLRELCKHLAKSLDCTVAATGEIDVIAGSAALYTVHNGHPLMGQVVGTGCMAASIIGAFAAVSEDPTEATAAALSVYGIAGQLAAQKAAGPGSFTGELFNALSRLDRSAVEAMSRIERR